MSGALAAASLPAGVIYSLANITGISDLGAITQTYRVTLRFGTDGFADIIRQINSDDLNIEQFCKPASRVSGLHVRLAKNSGDSLNFGEAEDTWHALTSTRDFIMEHTSSGGSDIRSGSFDIELSDDGGTTTLLSVTRTIQAGETF